MFDSPLSWLAALTALLWIFSTLDAGAGMRKVRVLRQIPPISPDRAPTVTVVVAARNEEEKIAPALRSLLAQDYPQLTVLVVNDRSTDGTGRILAELAEVSPGLRVLQLDSLPAGWLGKNHALQRGAEEARGEWLLFTDADVVMEPTVVARAMEYALREGVDHLTIAPKLVMPGAVLQAFGGMFAVFFARAAKPWKARDPKSRSHVGIGAFNLVRASAYRSAGGHRAIAMRPDDDLKLGKLLKRAGHRQDLVIGGDMVSVEWYSTVPEAVRGLEKNAFAGFDYSVATVVAACLLSLAIDVWPFAALFLTAGPTRWLNGISAALAVLTYAGSTRASGTRPVYALAYPLSTLLVLFIVVRSCALAIRNGGVHWRDTFYSLEQLRQNRI
jgi:cellulose synthase/poly-beta-1,6-N-acetylglucosamine synthase-like glycosyltransferase